MDAIPLLGLAFALLAIGLQLSPSYHNAVLSWIFLGVGLVMLLVGAVKAALGGKSGTPRTPMSEDWADVLQPLLIFGVIWALIVGMFVIIVLLRQYRT